MKKLLLILITAVGLTACTANEVEHKDESFEGNITVYTRDTASGTREAFMKGIGFVDAAEDDSLLVSGFVIADNAQIINNINNDEYGIGYISLSTLEGSGVKGLQFEGVTPSEENVLNNTYGLKRPFNYVIRADWDEMDEEKEISEAFIAYLGTQEGIAVIIDKGGIANFDGAPSWDDIKDQYQICTEDNSAITIKYGGSNSVSKIAKALSADFSPKCGNFVPEHEHTGSSDGFKRTQGSESEGANMKHIGFASRPFKDSEQGADGTQGQLSWDAVVAVVNEDNPLESITAEQLKTIYDGSITNWSELIK